MSRKLILMCGCPGAGKSTFCKEKRNFFGTSYTYVSRDEIRFSLVKENEEYFSKEDAVYKEFIEEIKKGLRISDTTVADATHLNKFSRIKLLNSLGASLKGIEIDVVYIKTDLVTALEQNEKRVGTRSYVPREQIKKMFNNLTIPELEEGFNKIYIVNNNTIERIIAED